MGTRRRGRLLHRAAAVLLFAASLPAGNAYLQPFQPVETARPVAKRQSGGCLANFYSCSDRGEGFRDICCQDGQVCSVDVNNSPACCPSNAVCTGTAPATFVTPTAGPTAVSYVPNSYFSFPYVATSFPNAGACSAAVSQCSRNFDTCSSELASGRDGGGGGGGGNYGVTIVVPGGGGTTVAPGNGGGGGGDPLGSASATSICSSLSSEACGGLSGDMCTNGGKSEGGFYIGTGAENAAARPTGACHGLGLRAAGVVAAGVGLGVVNGL